MKHIYETSNYIVWALDGVSEDKHHVLREDGGHIIISPKTKVVDRTQLTVKQAIELIRLTMVFGEAMAAAMNKIVVDIGRVNYQDNGNWGVFKPDGPCLHIHLYGRAKSAKAQKYGEALHFPKTDTGFYDKNNPLNDDDIAEVKKQIRLVFKKNKYKGSDWGLLSL